MRKRYRRSRKQNAILLEATRLRFRFVEGGWKDSSIGLQRLGSAHRTHWGRGSAGWNVVRVTCFVGERRCVGGADPRLSRPFPSRRVQRATGPAGEAHDPRPGTMSMFPGFEIPKYSPVSSAVLFGWFRSTLRMLPNGRHLDFGPGSKRDQSRPWPRRTGPCTPSSCDRAAQSHSARFSTLPSCPGATSVTMGQVRVAQRCPPATIRGAYWLVSVGCRCHARKPAHAVMSRAAFGHCLGGLGRPKWARIRRPTRSGRTGELTDSAAESRWAGKHPTQSF